MIKKYFKAGEVSNDAENLLVVSACTHTSKHCTKLYNHISSYVFEMSHEGIRVWAGDLYLFIYGPYGCSPFKDTKDDT